MKHWYVEAVYVDDTNKSVTRRYGDFKTARVDEKSLVINALEAAGLHPSLFNDIALPEPSDCDDGFDFLIPTNDGEWTVTIAAEPSRKPSKFVCVVNSQPVAIRNELSSPTVEALAAKLKIPVSAFSWIEVDDVE